MSKNQYLSFISLSFLLTILYSKCLTNESTVHGPYEWDMSVENHSGISKDLYSKDGKHRGMSVFNWHADKEESINQLVKNNIECVALVPFLYQETNLTKVLNPLEEIGAWDHYDSIYMDVIEKIHDRGMNIMLKPHIWMREGWRSDIQMDSQEEWDTWFESYRKHMIHYATMASKMDIELYCIGTELKKWIT